MTIDLADFLGMTPKVQTKRDRQVHWISSKVKILCVKGYCQEREKAICRMEENIYILSLMRIHHLNYLRTLTTLQQKTQTHKLKNAQRISPKTTANDQQACGKKLHIIRHQGK